MPQVISFRSFLRHLLAQGVGLLRLMVFRRDVPADLKVAGKTEIVRANLAKRESLAAAVKDVDVIVHFAGVLFKANPEQFLSTTNTGYLKNLVDVAKEKSVPKIVLISFPHVEGPTSIEKPARGRLTEPRSPFTQKRAWKRKNTCSQTCRCPFLSASAWSMGRAF